MGTDSELSGQVCCKNSGKFISKFSGKDVGNGVVMELKGRRTRKGRQWELSGKGVGRSVGKSVAKTVGRMNGKKEEGNEMRMEQE